MDLRHKKTESQINVQEEISKYWMLYTEHISRQAGKPMSKSQLLISLRSEKESNVGKQKVCQV